MKEESRKLYLNPSRQKRDQWIELKESEKIIKFTDIQSGAVEILPFTSKKLAKVNYQSYLENQDIRLPKTFIVEMNQFTERTAEFFVDAGLEVPLKKDLQKKYVVYHKNHGRYVTMIIDDFLNSLLPIIDYKYIMRVNNFGTEKKPRYPKITDGIFNPSIPEQAHAR